MIFAPILRKPVRISPVGRFPSNTSMSFKTTTDYSECLSIRMAAGRYRSSLKPAKLRSGSAAAERFRPPTASEISTLGYSANPAGPAIEGDSPVGEQLEDLIAKELRVLFGEQTV